MFHTKSIKRYKLILIKIIFAVLLSAPSRSVYSQVAGCKDPMANNYNAAATINDGSCAYNVTPYTPPIKTDPLNAILIESSGLQMAGNFLWSLNDGGGAAAIYNIDTLTSTIFQKVNLAGAVNVDWEAITFDGTFFYVGDFGNNANGARTDLKIYKFPLSAIPDYHINPEVTIPANQIEVINFKYSDQVQPPLAAPSNNTKFDCEAMMVDNGQIHLFSKNWIDLTTVHYSINSVAAGSYNAIPVDTLESGYLVTDAAKAPGQNITALLGYQAGGAGNHYMHLLSDYSGGNYFNGNKRRIDLPGAISMGQAEGITFRNSTYGYITNEKLFTITQKLRSFSSSDFIPLYVLPLSLKKFTVNALNGENKIAWHFENPVNNLSLEYSTNGVHFTILKEYSRSLMDTFFHKPLSAVAYYRINWKQERSARHYSTVISVKKNKQTAVSNFVLKANGQLSFLLNSSSSYSCSFKILSADGKLLTQTTKQSYAPGLNKINISKKSIVNNFVYLVVQSDKNETTTFLRVEN